MGDVVVVACGWSVRFLYGFLPICGASPMGPGEGV